MKFYPTFFSTNLYLEAMANPPSDRLTYNQYIISLGKIWCKSHGVLYSTLVASLLTAVLQGNILIEEKPSKDIIKSAWGDRVTRAIKPIQPCDIMYNVYTKHHTLLSDYDDLDFMLGYKDFLLNKLGSI